MEGRALWSGIVTFGLVSIPVKLYTATDSKTVSFNQIHAKCKTKIQEKRWCPTCDRYVEWDEIEKGFEYTKGKYIPITKEDLESIPLPSKNTIAVQSFVKVSEIDPIYFERSYYIEPDKKSLRPFTLLMQTLTQKELVGIGAFTIRTKERLCCIRPIGGVLIIDTLLYPDEIKVDLKTKLPQTKLSAAEKKMANSLVEMMTQTFSPADFKDHYREALEKLIDAKLEGVDLHPDDEEPAQKNKEPSDLMDSLRRSLKVIQGGKSSKKNLPAGHSKTASRPKTNKVMKPLVKISKTRSLKSKVHSAEVEGKKKDTSAGELIDYLPAQDGFTEMAI